MREGGMTREGQHDERVSEKAQRTETTVTETTRTETETTTKKVTMATTMNDDNVEGDERQRFNDQSA